MSLKKLGRYELIRVLGKGAMGVVYEGRDPNLDRRVAIKTVRVENLSESAAVEYEARFRTEARSAARLQHPNIVSVYDSDRDGDVAFLVMEYIQGDDLKHHLDRGVRYTLEQCLRIIRDLLAALDYAHKQGIVHRDIKPANLLIEPAGRVKLTDFGVARIQDSGEATRTQGSMVGTLKYMSPEQVQGQKIDSRSDLFSVGVVLYQLLTDRRPFDGDNDFSIIHQIIGHTPEPPSQCNPRLPAAIDAVVARALAKNRDERFQTAREFAVALQAAIRRAEDTTVVPPANPQRRVGDAANTGSRGGAGSTVPMSATTPSASSITQELELVYWKDVKDSADPEEFEMFLAKFPSGVYADLAARRLRKLLVGRQSPDSTILTGLAPPVAPGGPATDPDLEETRVGAAKEAAPSPAGASTPSPPSEGGAPHRGPGFAASSGFPSTVAQTQGGDDTTLPLAAPGHGAPGNDATASKSAHAAVEPIMAASPAPPSDGAAAATGASDALVQPGAVLRRKSPPSWASLALLGLVVAVGLVFWNSRPAPVDASPSDPTPARADAGQEPAATAPPNTTDTLPTPTTTVHADAALPSTATGSVAKPTATTTGSDSAVTRSVALRQPSPSRPIAVTAVGSVSVPGAATPESAGGPQPGTGADAPAPARVPPAYDPAPPPAPVGPATGPEEACAGRLFIAREVCMREQCDRAVFRNHPVCVKRREVEQWRQEQERMRQGSQ